MAHHQAETAQGSFDDMNFHTRKWVRPEDLNANGTLFGGSLLRWIDDEAVVYAMIQLGNQRIVTKFISEINFVSSATKGDIIEIGLQAIAFGRTSLTMRCEVRNIITGRAILSIERIVFVGLDAEGAPLEHGFTGVTYQRDRFPEELRNKEPGL
ncbi:acyl-CoA thioesterase [Kocuria massiliensis]|uniref:acyl-CoA thioesterase n=1 Tax=Kocuria massiliensis TaxID=1926282 RepID=UPI0022B9621D|nr:hotdog domain-containing protein [Kocuria massiliensis]